MTNSDGEEILEYGTIETALRFLKENRSYLVGDVGLGATKPGFLDVSGMSNSWLWKSITKESALIELEEIAFLFDKMIAASTELKEFIVGRVIRFHLYFNDAGKTAIPICTKQDDIVTWTRGIK